jgi:hypothetical protein
MRALALRLSGAGARPHLIAAGAICLVLAVFIWAPQFLATIESKLYDLHFALRRGRSWPSSSRRSRRPAPRSWRSTCC